MERGEGTEGGWGGGRCQMAEGRGVRAQRDDHEKGGSRGGGRREMKGRGKWGMRDG